MIDFKCILLTFIVAIDRLPSTERNISFHYYDSRKMNLSAFIVLTINALQLRTLNKYRNIPCIPIQLV